MIVDRRVVVGGIAASVVPLQSAVARLPRTGMTLEAGPGTLRITDGDTVVWAFNGQVPGPLLRITQGESVEVSLSNKLPQPTSLCWHGVRITNGMDGVAGLTQDPVKPGETFAYRFTPPDSGLYWYHPHVWPNSAEQIGRGLYGVLIVDEADPPPVDGDLLVVLDDWMLDAHGQIRDGMLDASEARGDGRIGSLVTVNSKAVPERRTLRPGARVRLRLLNACSARIAVVSIVGLRATVLAIDGQPSELFEPGRGTVPVGPGSRFELMLDVPSQALSDPANAAAIVLRGDGTPDQPLVTFATGGTALASRGAVAKLPDNPRLPTRIHLENSLKYDLAIAVETPPSDKDRLPLSKTAVEAASADRRMYWTLNGRSSDGFSGAPLFTVKRGQPVTLAFINRSDVAQQMHVHGHVFRVLHDLDDGWDPYWRESILIAPGKTKHVAFVADNPGRWTVESLTLARQVTGLAGYFVVNDTGR